MFLNSDDRGVEDEREGEGVRETDGVKQERQDEGIDGWEMERDGEGEGEREIDGVESEREREEEEYEVPQGVFSIIIYV